MNEFLKRTWALINLDNLHYNIKSIKNKLQPNTKIIAVVKADGYGHGDLNIARTLEQDGIDFFAVSNLDEALSLRQGGIKSDILILGYTPAKKADELAKLHISQSVFSSEYAHALSEACTEYNCTVNVHVKLDTGMTRIGFVQNDVHNAADEIEKIHALNGLNFVGIFTHFSSADCLDEPSQEYTQLQISRFEKAVADLAKRDITFSHIHMQNSAGIAFLPQLHFTHVRAGIILYGVAPSNEKLDFPLKPVMELKSVISMVKEVESGVAISYGRKFVTSEVTKIATVPIGYADGYPRLLSNKGEMLLHGKRVKILGNICMDQLMLDVTNIDNVCEGDIVTVVGTDGNETISFDELANQIGTISYELMCLIGRRVPRVYKQAGKTTAVIDYLKV